MTNKNIETRGPLTINTKGANKAKSLIEAGKINTDSDWTFTASDGNALLGANGDDWTNYGSFHLAVNKEFKEDTKQHYGFPFGKNGEVYRSALIAIRQRAGQYDYPEIFEAAGKLIELIDADEKMNTTIKNENMKKTDKRFIAEVKETPERVTVVYEKDENFSDITNIGEAIKKDLEDFYGKKADTTIDKVEDEVEEVKDEVEEVEEVVEEENNDTTDKVEFLSKKDKAKKYYKSNSKYEQRAFANSEFRIQDTETGNKVVGYASVFNKQSEDLGGFREVIKEGAFSSVLDNDVRALFNHDSNMILGRTSAGTLRLEQDEQGLKYEIDMPNTSFAKDLTESMKRGDITQSSFGFIIDDDEWNETEKGVVRTINSVRALLDVSPVTFPAYPDASVGLRGLDTFKKEQTNNKKDFHKRNIRELQLKFLKTNL